MAWKLSRLQAGGHLALGDLLVEGDAVVDKQGVGLLMLHVRPGTFKGLVAEVVVYSHLRQKQTWLAFNSSSLTAHSFRTYWCKSRWVNNCIEVLNEWNLGLWAPSIFLCMYMRTFQSVGNPIDLYCTIIIHYYYWHGRKRSLSNNMT